MTTQQQTDSRTNVNPVRVHGLGIWGNPRVVMGVRVDSELKKRFKTVSRRVFGSTCRPIESFMATVVSCAENGVNFGNTIEIGSIVIERNLARERRNLRLGSESEGGRCHYCRKVPVGVFEYKATGEAYPLCRVHAEMFLDGKKWSVVKE